MNTKNRISLLVILGIAIFSVNICAQTPKADLLDIHFNADGTATDVSGRNHPIVSSQPLQSSGFGFDISWFSNNDLSFLIHDGSQYVGVTDESMEEGKYYHAVGVVRPNNAISFYINGELIGTTPFTTIRIPSGSCQKLYVGCDVSGNGNSEYAFKGEIVVARMYSRALTDKEVKSIYDDFSPNMNAPKADLLDIHFNADGTATDVSGRNHPIVSSQPLQD